MAIRHPGEGEAEAVMATLVAAFAADPVSRWVLPEAAQYLCVFPHVLRHMGGAALSLGTALATEEGRAVALWLPPGHGPDMAALAMAFAEAGVMPPEDAPAFFAAMAEAHPGAPHWYLPFIGVDPVVQGRGLGSALMEAALTRVDRERLPAYLENSNPRNRALYERFGFEVVCDIRVGASPLMQPMWRPAR